jgi:DnaJ-domain-containing protein 1
MSRTFYQTLGVEAGAENEEIKVAYRALVRQVHPDLHRQCPPEEVAYYEAQIRALNEAYSILMNADRRGLYDRSLAQGFNFYEAEENSRPESEAEREVREAADQLMEAGRLKAVEAVLAGVCGLLPQAKWLREEQVDPYFDALLRTHHGPIRVMIYIKILHQLHPEDLPGVVQFAEATLALAPSGLIREQHGYLLLGRQVEGNARIYNEVEACNLKNWSAVKGRAPRAFLAYGDLRNGKVFSPGASDAEPRLRDLQLDLKRFFRF